MEVRLLIAFLLMGAVMFLTPYLFKTQPPPPAKKDTAAQTATLPAGQPPANPGGVPAPPSEAPAEAPRHDRGPGPRRNCRRNPNPPSSSKPISTRSPSATRVRRCAVGN